MMARNSFSRGGFVNPLIREPLTADTLEQSGSAFLVVDALRFAVVVAEVEFRNVALKMLLADVLVNPGKATLENREEPFNRVRRHVTASVFLASMVHAGVLRELLANAPVARGFVGHKVRAAVNLAAENRLEVSRRHAGDVEGTHIAATLDKGNDAVLVLAAALRDLHALLVAVIGLVNFNDLARAAELAGRRCLHRLTDAVAHEPGRLVGHAKNALKLLAADALFGRANQVRGVNPLMKGNLGILENGAYGHAELCTAVATEQEAGAVALALKAAVALYAATVRTYRAFRPAGFLKVFTGGGFAVESGFGMGGWGLGFHGLSLR